MAVQRWQEGIGEFDRIDREAGVIRGVRILQPKSKNGRRYLQEAYQGASRLYEQMRVYIDHIDPDKKSKQRRKADRWGRLVNVTEDAGGVVGDLEYLKSHPMTEQILESIERFQDTGLSHDASGVQERRGGEVVVTKIVKVHSVDFVEEAATNRNLFEEYRGEPMKKKVLAVLREGVEDKSVSRFLARLSEAVSDVKPLEQLEIEPVDGETDEQIRSAAGGALVSALFEGRTFAEASKLASELFALPVEKKEGEAGGDTSLVESLQRELSELKAERQREKDHAECKRLIEAAGAEATDSRIEWLAAVAPEKRDALAKEFPKKREKPAHSAGVTTRVTEAADEGKIPENHDLKAALGYK